MNKSLKVDKQSVISKDYLNIIVNADTVTWCLLDPMSSDTICKDNKELGEILAERTDTLKERLHAIKGLLSSPSSFTKKNIVKECTFLPDIVVVFSLKSDTVKFYYSFYCDLCRFDKFGKYQEIDGDIIRKAILQMSCEIFPKDRYLRLLKRREK